MTESLADLPRPVSALPPTYLPRGEKQRTCLVGRIWNLSDGAGPNPESLSRQFRVDIDTRVGKNRAC